MRSASMMMIWYNPVPYLVCRYLQEMSVHQYQGLNRFSFIHRTMMMMMMMIFLFLLQFHIFSQQQAYSSFQLQFHSAFTSSNTDSDSNVENKFCIVHRSMHCIALHCNAVRECQVDRQTDKIHEKFPNQTWIRYLPEDLDHRWAHTIVRFVLPRLVV